MNKLIDGRQKRSVKLVEGTLTFAGWSYIALFLLQFGITLALWFFHMDSFQTELLNYRNLMDTLHIIIVTAAAALSGFIAIQGWCIYNKRKYGMLNRRKFPAPVTDEQLSAHFGLPIKQVRKLQNLKRIVLDETIV